jgi:exodeoxyribonuclease-5
MIPRSLSSLLEDTCKTNKCKIIYIGDGSQLPPVNEKYSSSLRGVTTYTLNQIVRQEEDNPMRYLLELLRYDIKHKSFKFLEYIGRHREQFDSGFTKGFRVCSSNEFNELVFRNFSDENITRNVDYCRVVAYTNDCVAYWNNCIRNVIIKDANKAVITKNDLLTSYTTLVDSFNNPILKNSEEYIVNDIVDYLHPKYGFRGFMIKFQAIHGGAISNPLFVLDHSDMFSVQKYVQVADKLISEAKNANSKVRSEKWKEYYRFKETCLLLTDFKKTDGTLLYKRDIDYGFALTSHKSQGSTFDTVFVDVMDIVYDKYGHPYVNAEEINRRLYVACSRAKNKLYLKYGR